MRRRSFSSQDWRQREGMDMRQLWERASGRRRFSIGVRHGRRPLALTLLVIGAAAGILLQLGPAHASSEEASATRPSATKQQALAAYGKLPLAFTANAGQTDARVRYSAQGAGFSVFFTRREAMLALQRPGKQARAGGRSRSASSAPTGTSRSAATPRAGQGQLPARQRPLQVAHRPAYLRARRLPQPLARHGHGLPRAQGQAEVRVPRPPRSPRQRHPARLPRREAALARPARKPALDTRSASSPTRGR